MPCKIREQQITYYECGWILEIVGDFVLIKNFTMTYSMRLAILNAIMSLNLLSVAENSFCKCSCDVEEVQTHKTKGLLAMFTSDKLFCYRDDDKVFLLHSKIKQACRAYYTVNNKLLIF